MTFRGNMDGYFVTNLTPLHEAELKRIRKGRKSWYSLTFYSGSDHGGFLGFEPKLFPCTREGLELAVRHAEMYCGLLRPFDPDPRPRLIEVPTFGTCQQAYTR